MPCVCSTGPGIPVFKTLPSGEPPLAKYKQTELEWKRLEFEGSLRQWFRFMVVKDAAAMSDIKEEWNKTLDRLPASDDPNNLAPELKPVWRELPSCTAVPTARRGSDILDGVSTLLENPPINPVTSAGRTQTEVRRETLAYRTYLRRINKEALIPPIFLSDYVFVKLGSKPVFLARVVNNCSIDDALLADISVTIGEYQAVDGFFGYFTKAPNTTYNPLDRRTGGKFVRHANVTRQDILVFNVQTWVDRQLLAERAADDAEPADCIRVAAASLRELAAVYPAFSMPAQVPSSHRTQDAAAAAADQRAARRATEGDDPPPPIPSAFAQTPWEAGDAVLHFMIWTKLDNAGARWHQARVTKVHPPGRRGGYTHDARFSDGVRGVRLTEDAYSDGCWVAMRTTQPPPVAPPVDPPVDPPVAVRSTSQPMPNPKKRQRRRK